MRLKVGKIINTHALKGELKIMSTSDFIDERLKVGSVLLISRGNQVIKEVIVENAREHKGFFLVKFEGIDNIEEAEKFKNLQLKVDEENLSDLEDGEFYFYEIIGCKVIDENKNIVGEIVDILQTGANDVWVIKTDKNKEILIPYIEEVVKNIDIDNKIINIELMEGLI
ncbi:MULTISPECIES: ribosome maturation factor RimM [unclassified Gemella]|uniref:ribosome maturation factor RimM n=1 Tax=unclassified Gemella TaxID=2624949 RepID=UPI00107308EE|nr:MULTISPECIES: ribosome maturation factor RimM [unclassified Gemella]MBF0710204.1 ribosome maturation factor RimM [Gemella sp. GL1.1]MBF0746504.1 ribosome maturation factor RimM [Gemella sp. 19428wG2_WT2a]NYS27548.1 ribosome maturation factor RimM [Gemella sp. GL1]TFU60282.1 ribosome maturation factor RimM [Gemella sp. WT2a]